jgi:hypothetical protein
MKLPKFTTLILLALLSCSAYADTNSAQDTPPGPGFEAPSHPRRNMSPKSSPDEIRGTCTVLQSATNPLSGPCVKTWIGLYDSKGNEILRTQTSQSGNFVFSPEDDESYTIRPISALYDVSEKTKPKLAHRGERVRLALTQK